MWFAIAKMSDSEPNQTTAENKAPSGGKDEKPKPGWWQRIEPGIVVGVVIILVFSVWFVNTPSFESLLGILTGITALISFIPKKNIKYNWLLICISMAVAGAGIVIIKLANDPEEINIVGIFNDGAKSQEGDEYVVIRNDDTRAIQLEGWTLNDNQSNHVFTFPNYEIQPGQECRIYTNEDHPEWCGFNFRNGGSGVWNNDEDMATLRNAEGVMIDSSIDLILTAQEKATQPAPAVVMATRPTPTLPPDYDDLECIPRNTARVVGRTVAVIDGRTIEVELEDEKVVVVQYLGVATIVKGQPLYEQSLEINKGLVLDKPVTLVEDTSRPEITDGLLLRYVFVGDSFINRELISGGYAVPDGDGSCLEHFINMNMAAFESDAGFAGSDEEIYGDPFFDTPPVGYFDQDTSASDQVRIVEIFSNGITGAQEPDEYVEIQNQGAAAIQLKDWMLSDESGHSFIFPEFMLQPGKRCRIYTNEDHPEWCGFSFENSQAIWGNSGDCATLKDRQARIVDEACYK
jgi:endonuclease YncB( thermonuclease family)